MESTIWKSYMNSNGYQSTPLLKILHLMTKQAIVVIVVSKLNLQRECFYSYPSLIYQPTNW